VAIPVPGVRGRGAAFVLVYIGLMLLIGIPAHAGRVRDRPLRQRAPVGSLRKLGGPVWGRLGLPVRVRRICHPCVLLVIAGWTVRYGIEAVVQGFGPSAADHFAAVASGSDAVAFHVAFMRPRH